MSIIPTTPRRIVHGDVRPIRSTRTCTSCGGRIQSFRIMKRGSDVVGCRDHNLIGACDCSIVVMRFTVTSTSTISRAACKFSAGTTFYREFVEARGSMYRDMRIKMLANLIEQRRHCGLTR